MTKKDIPVSDLSLQLEIIKKGAVEIIELAELESKLKKSIETKKPLNIKAGFDPTSADLHLGHTVLMNKLKAFQDLGHKIFFIIGDFTARIGDPSGRNEMRKPLSDEEIIENAKTYSEQAFKILDRERTTIVYNSSWMNKLTPSDFIKLASKHTVARMLERDDFSKRFSENKPIGIHELFYPIIQGYDSVAIDADIEIGGTDQKFNLLVGRNLQRMMGKPQQTVITMPILEGLDGVQKMSKSLNNYVGITEPPKEMYGKIMSITDELMLRYYELLTDMRQSEIEELKLKINNGSLHPMEAKQHLAYMIVARFHSEKDAKFAEEEFVRQFRERKIPQAIDEIKVKCDDGDIWICRLLKEIKAVSSTSEARRKITEGAVRIEGNKINDVNLSLPAKGKVLIQVGKKRFYRADFEN
ncbi:MAG: tyrosine--tRNA ligase [Candidatus Schekmanbacteria bacterium]|nr:MAG: tyrosine--tRNA ligase [Candidatus Schekmanbacteria bacterium]